MALLAVGIGVSSLPSSAHARSFDRDLAQRVDATFRANFRDARPGATGDTFFEVLTQHDIQYRELTDDGYFVFKLDPAKKAGKDRRLYRKSIYETFRAVLHTFGVLRMGHDQNTLNEVAQLFCGTYGRGIKEMYGKKGGNKGFDPNQCEMSTGRYAEIAYSRNVHHTGKGKKVQWAAWVTSRHGAREVLMWPPHAELAVHASIVRYMDPTWPDRPSLIGRAEFPPDYRGVPPVPLVAPLEPGAPGSEGPGGSGGQGGAGAGPTHPVEIRANGFEVTVGCDDGETPTIETPAGLDGSIKIKVCQPDPAALPSRPGDGTPDGAGKPTPGAGPDPGTAGARKPPTGPAQERNRRHIASPFYIQVRVGPNQTEEQATTVNKAGDQTAKFDTTASGFAYDLLVRGLVQPDAFPEWFYLVGQLEAGLFSYSNGDLSGEHGGVPINIPFSGSPYDLNLALGVAFQTTDVNTALFAHQLRILGMYDRNWADFDPNESPNDSASNERTEQGGGLAIAYEPRLRFWEHVDVFGDAQLRVLWKGTEQTNGKDYDADILTPSSELRLGGGVRVEGSYVGGQIYGYWFPHRQAGGEDAPVRTGSGYELGGMATFLNGKIGAGVAHRSLEESVDDLQKFGHTVMNTRSGTFFLFQYQH